MSMEFEKIDDILTDERREDLMSNHRRARDRVKGVAIDLIDDAQDGKYDYRKGVQIFDDVAEINDALNVMADVMYEYDTSYSLLLEKYNEIVQQLAESE